MTRNPIPLLTDSDIQRFWQKVDRSSGCWEWKASFSGKYGQFGIGRSAWYAHRVAWTIANGPIPDRRYICHSCDNPSCVRPEHLFIGTPTDNVRDCIAKGRDARGEKKAVRGERNGMSRPEVKEKHRAICASEEYRAKLSAAQKGKPKSDEHRKKISDAHKERHRRKREDTA